MKKKIEAHKSLWVEAARSPMILSYYATIFHWRDTIIPRVWIRGSYTSRGQSYKHTNPTKKQSQNSQEIMFDLDSIDELRD